MAVSILRTVGSVLSIEVILEICFTVGGERGGKGPAARLWWASLGIYLLSEVIGAVFDTIAHFLRRERDANATPRLGGYEVLPVARF